MAVRHSPARRGFPAAEETQRPSFPREAAGLLGRIRAQEMAGAGEVAQAPVPILHEIAQPRTERVADLLMQTPCAMMRSAKS